MRVLLVEDEQILAEAVRHMLKKQNIETDVALDGDEGILLALKDIYDVVVLDIMLPGKSGMDILKAMRKERMVTPVLLLTAKDSIQHRVEGLDAGADDYLVKPFAMEELISRVKALGRRLPAIAGEFLTVGDITLDMQKVSLLIGEKEVRLSAREFQLMEMFMRRPGQTFSREYILDRVWGYEADISENSIEAYIHMLRKKLSDSAVEIVTMRGIGYILQEREKK